MSDCATDTAGSHLLTPRHALLAALLGLLFLASPAPAAESPPYELDATLSLRGDCGAESIDPIPDPDCSGEPPAYPAPPNRPDGQFNYPRAIAVDLSGNTYVASSAESNDAKGRVDVFDDEGHFLAKLAAPNAKSIAVDGKGNLYVFEDNGKVVRYPPSEYEPEAGDIAYGNPAVPVATAEFIGALAVDPTNDQLFVSSNGTITRYKSALEGSGALESFSLNGGANWAEAIAIDGQRKRIYVTFCPAGKTTECGVKVFDRDAPHTLLQEIQEVPTTPTPTKFAADFARMGLAVDEATGDFFIGDIPAVKTVYRFNEAFEYLSRRKSNNFQTNIAVQIAVSNGKRSLTAESCAYPDPAEAPVPAGDACNRHYLFVPVYESAGRVLAFRPPAQTPPQIEAVSTGPIGEQEAELRARIHPGGLDTEYSFQITTAEAFEAEGFEGATTIGEATIAAASLPRELSAHATGLQPGQSYRFRAVASNELGEAAQDPKTEAAFTTYDDAPSPQACPNQALRTGVSSELPDCRAYELVTPPDTSGRPPKGTGLVGANLFPNIESSPAGDAVWFRIEGGSLQGGTGVGSFDGDPYVARRGPSGWNSTLEGPSGDEATAMIPGSSSPDQGYSFWSARIEGPLVINGEETQYVRYPDGHSELIGRGSLGEEPRARGRLITEDGTHIVFETFQIEFKVPTQLEPEAPPGAAIYDRTIDPLTGDEETHVVSLLPGNVTPAAGEKESYRGASPDGEGIAFELGGVLYLRVGNETTYEIGTNVDFAGISEGAERVFYLQAGDLFAFDVATETVIPFTTSKEVNAAVVGDVTPVNVATGGTRAYFVSPTVLGGANPEGDLPQAGEQNLYLSEEGVISFIGTITDRDVKGEGEETGVTDGLGLWTLFGSTQPARDPSRTNPAGSILLFQSRANLTGYDPGKSPQVFRYDSAADRLHCISCIPTRVPAGGGASLETVTFDGTAPPPLGPSAYVRNLNPAGNRAFFESTEALVSSDTDGVNDVYEWEDQGVGSCKQAGGCVYLISSGQSDRDNYLYAHSTDGDDVFFSSGDLLTVEDSSGTRSIYDARVGGGFAAPSVPGECLGEACQPATSLPAESSPASASFQGPGNVTQRSRNHPCPKGKRKVKRGGKQRCVPKPRKRRHHANHKKGAAR